MYKLRPLVLALGFLTVLAIPVSVKADPLFFSNVGVLQNNNITTVDLLANPGVTVTGQQLTFRVDVTGTLPAGQTNTLLISYQAAGSSAIVQTFEIPLFGFVEPPFTHLFTIILTGATPEGVNAILTVDIIGSNPDFVIPSGPSAGQVVDSYTYNFRVIQTVPEPASIIILGMGMVGLASRIRHRRHSQRSL